MVIGTSTPSRISPKIAVLGSVSLLMGIASSMVLSLLPSFLVRVIGASALWVGTIEGLAEATASFVKIFSGAISDGIGRRKPLVVAGYGLSAVIKLVFPLAQTVTHVLVARMVDRIGKGIRDAPRDALVADITTGGTHGTGFSLRHALFSIGTLLGPLLAIACMWLTADNFRLVYWIATVPAFLALAVLVWGIAEVPASNTPAPRRRFARGDLHRLSPRFWNLVAFAGIVSLARVSSAFLILKAVSVGVDPGFAPLVLVLMNAVNATASYPIGIVADHLGTRPFLAAGAAILLLADLVLAVSTSAAGAAIGAALWGLQMGTMQALFAAVIADAVPADLRGAAFGVFDFAIGVAALSASILAGGLWVLGGPALTFAAGAVFSLAGLALLPRLRAA